MKLKKINLTKNNNKKIKIKFKIKKFKRTIYNFGLIDEIKKKTLQKDLKQKLTSNLQKLTSNLKWEKRKRKGKLRIVDRSTWLSMTVKR